MAGKRSKMQSQSSMMIGTFITSEGESLSSILWSKVMMESKQLRVVEKRTKWRSLGGSCTK